MKVNNKTLDYKWKLKENEKYFPGVYMRYGDNEVKIMKEIEINTLKPNQTQIYEERIA